MSARGQVTVVIGQQEDSGTVKVSRRTSVCEERSARGPLAETRGGGWENRSAGQSWYGGEVSSRGSSEQGTGRDVL
jgi:hypothetical protein